ncbi:MAG: NADH-quinone oxidoreductase subunit H [Polyangiaceae bacterium]|nr:NADH-quinone oxidoreductase subunit H [Polyangiaceae bacterium]
MMHYLVHVLLVLALPPLLLGIANRVKALFAGRRGPPVLQLYFDLAKLARKSTVQSRTTSFVFRAGPVVALATTACAAMLVPLGAHKAPLSFGGDLVFFAYLFALGRFFTVAAALDTGSAFEGMGGAREVTFGALAEPALFFGLLVLTRLGGAVRFAVVLGPGLADHWVEAAPSLVLVAVSLFVVLLSETCRVPFDDPNTHLELTMIHEVMVLDHGGPALGMILYGAAMKLFVLGAVVVGVALPASSGNAWLDWLLFLGGMLGCTVLVGVVESIMARLKLVAVPKLLVTACLLSAVGLVLLVR